LAVIDAVWAIAPGPSWSVNSPDANEGLLAISVPPVVVVFQILVRVPLTVFVEESLFRGWVQNRHGAIASALLFAVYHLAQWWTIPALVPFALAPSLLRVATRSIWPGATIHAVGNIVYVFTLA
jgi:membrane protease YdiL (CAAX protease family)